jgi:hypothetical protein
MRTTVTTSLAVLGLAGATMLFALTHAGADANRGRPLAQPGSEALCAAGTGFRTVSRVR